MQTSKKMFLMHVEFCLTVLKNEVFGHKKMLGPLDI